MNLKYCYGVCIPEDEEVFEAQCAALEQLVPGIVTEERDEDPIEGSVFQHYTLDGARIMVTLSYYDCDVHIDSDVDLEPFNAILKQRAG